MFRAKTTRALLIAAATLGAVTVGAITAGPASADAPVACIGANVDNITGDGVQIHTRASGRSTVVGLAYHGHDVFCDDKYSNGWIHGTYYGGPIPKTGWVWHAYVQPDA